MGDFKSISTLKVQIAYDDVPTIVDTFTISSANATFNNSVFQFECFPSNQKCESIQITISEVTPTGESFDLTDMEIVFAMQPDRRFPLNSNKQAL